MERITVIQPEESLFQLELKALWEQRRLLYFMVWRDIKIRYKQAVIGVGWAVLQPLITMVIFTLLFRNLAKIPSDGLPYPIFAYAGLLPWNYFAGSLNRSIHSVAGNTYLISKVYFPRLFLPLSGTVSGMVDFSISFCLLLGMMAFYGMTPTWGILALPVFLLLALLTALAVGLWCSALNVKYRDVGHTLPFVTQVWMFASPVVYPVSLVPEQWRYLYGFNPMAGVIEGFRWALLGKTAPDVGLMAASTAVVLVILFFGIIFFKRMERTFADVI